MILSIVFNAQKRSKVIDTKVTNPDPDFQTLYRKGLIDFKEGSGELLRQLFALKAVGL